ncbi:MAG: (d)CMP kinase [Nanoarchaeota archaeon]|nr:(d)CMP kinase [Nanoarchaeota archaeon]
MLNSEKKINIAIDGPVGCGKSTTAKMLAKKLNYIFLDTGAMYRAIGYYMKSNNIFKNNFNPQILNNIEMHFDENAEIILNKKNIAKEIRTPEIGQAASDFGTIKEIREFLVKQQQEIVKDKGFIAEGRDIASTVIPQAELKIYLTASVEERAKRRYLDFKEKNIKISIEEVKKQVEIRDYQDMNREISPLIKTEDAIEVDTSNLNIEEQAEKIYKLALERIEN